MCSVLVLKMATKEELLIYGFLRASDELALLPAEIVLLFLTWFGLFRDTIDESLSDKVMEVQTIEGDNPHQVIIRKDTEHWSDYNTAIGQKII